MYTYSNRICKSFCLLVNLKSSFWYPIPIVKYTAKYREMWKIFNFSGNEKFRIFRNETFSSNYISKVFVCHKSQLLSSSLLFFKTETIQGGWFWSKYLLFSTSSTKSNVKDSTFYQPDLSRASCGCQLSSSKM